MSDCISTRPIPPTGRAYKRDEKEPPVSEYYTVLDTDLARDNVENDIPSIDLEGI